jgi:hypothetical protein
MPKFVAIFYTTDHRKVGLMLKDGYDPELFDTEKACDEEAQRRHHVMSDDYRYKVIEL